MSKSIKIGIWAIVGVSLACTFLTAPVDGRPPGDRPASRAGELLVPELKVEKYTLSNGLTVILHEDHKTPLVAVNVLYKVGSKDDEPGRSGLAHLFEHMMFEGSKHSTRYEGAFQGLGATLDGRTGEDQTVYSETVPKNGLERILWAEADRMGFLLPELTPEKLDNVREVIKNERRQKVDSVPYGQSAEVLREAIYPQGHPYRNSGFGSMAGISAASMSDVLAFYRKHYAPNSAFLCIAGDFQPDQTRRWIAKYFGPLPRGLESSPLKANVPSLREARKITLADRVSWSRIKLVWTTVPANHPDEPALDVLAAVLGGLAKESRLCRALQYDRPLATGVDASHPTKLMAGTFEIWLYAPPGQRLDELVGIVDVEIERLKRDGPTADEVCKAQDERERTLVMGLESVASKAETLNQYAATLGDPLTYRSVLVKVFEVTPEDVKRVARHYLGARRIELDVIPGEPAARPAEPAWPIPQGLDPTPPAAQDLNAFVAFLGSMVDGADAILRIRDGFDRAVMPRLGPKPRFTPPRFERRKLSNGLEILIVERHGLPLVNFDLIVKSGETLAPRGKEGLGSITASLLDEGTRSRKALQLASELSDIGASLATYGALESTQVSLSMLTRHLERGLDLYADVILNPSFPESELALLKQERLLNLKARGDDAELVAMDVFPRLIYGPDHPYGRPERGTPGSIQSITRDDVVAFYRKIFVPSNAALVVVGDVRPDAITDALESRFRTWAPGPIPRHLSLPPTPAPAGYGSVFLIDKPGAVQSILTLCKVGVARKSPDFHALMVMNKILSYRISNNLRGDKGYTYGVSSTFHERRGPGPFELGCAIQTDATTTALAELIQELTDIAGPESVTDEDRTWAKEQIVFNDYSEFETAIATARQLASHVISDLPDADFGSYPARIEAVTGAEVDRVARKYITPERMTILIVGDQSRVESSLRRLPFVKGLRRLDSTGNPRPPAAVVFPPILESGNPFAIDASPPGAKNTESDPPRTQERKAPASNPRPQ